MPRPTNLLDLVRSAGERPFGTLTPEEQRVKDYTTVDPRVRLKDLAELAGQSVPGLGDILRGAIAARDFQQGNYGQAALNALDILPFVAGSVRASKLPGMTKYELAHKIAQKNAAKPVEKGGLGLPPDNTALDRMKAMYEDMDLFHGTNADITNFALDKGGKVSRSPVGLLGVSVADNPEIANEFADLAAKVHERHQGDYSGGNVLPLVHRTENPATLDLPEDATNLEVYGAIKDAFELGHDVVRIKNYTTPSGKKIGPAYIIKDPSQLRSRFAAFDPLKRHSDDILAGMAGLGILGRQREEEEPGFASGGLVGPQVVALKNPEGPKIRPIPIQYGPSIRPVNLMDLARSVGEQPFGELTPEEQRVKDYTTVDPRVRMKDIAELATQSVPGIGDVLSGVMAARDIERGDYGQAALNALGVLPMIGGLGAIKAYHGSPHRFDKFDMSKIGTGEGAQAYGNGLYFSEHPDVALSYTPRDAQFEDRVMKLYKKAEAIGDYAAAEVFERYLLHDTPSDIARYISKMDADKRYISSAQRALKKVEPLWRKQSGQLYETSLEWPDPAREAADPMGAQHFLDWDKPLSEQPENIIETLKKSRNKHIRGMLEYLEKPYPEYIGDKKTMESGLRLLGLNLEGKTNMNSQKAAALLSKQGIPGIRYLDQGSRGTGQGTYNYVVFDENIPKITAINDQPVARLQNEIDQFLQGSQQGGAERRRAK